MTVKFKGYDFVDGGVCAASGFQAAGVHCGLRKNRTKPDLALIYSETLCSAAAVYTQNKVKGAPIIVTQQNLKDNKAQAVIVNSGNANTCNLDGEEKAEMMCVAIAKELGISANDVVVASTGIIGEPLPVELIQAACPQLKDELNVNGNENASLAILTTDTCKKEVAVTFDINGVKCTLGGMAKGSGMIHPNMATMLCFLTTDVAVEPTLLQKALRDVTNETFNMISVDGDTSTNDMVTILASGTALNKEIVNPNSEEYKIFANALYAVMMNLSRAIAQDGEGASKLLECTVCGANDKQIAKTVAKSVITSSLVKSAMFGQDPNWGRILCAIGYAQADLDINNVSVRLKSTFGDVKVCKGGRGVTFDKEQVLNILRADEVKIIICVGTGDYSAVAWGCDLTYDYVKINADYHT
ncbi:bifunctional glutamate N-acetyltransferase/amino-acid acetyltransferase ArgJ [Paludicola sp. MB14-C6]|uniref:bifunctional glutamate N-acetyltransferase/amino-acid acetyltransferase ArgJ n=1 Tax=Paludihabitans sp. MB14-C6 TaxID=3070656 RepID=UPI0027DD65CC|nr:bifunctional glutamate N-acetyltransferase/amino-acid acetyltransferase ArgJ [Paludicola sp. MB14-C6]WMJ22182.1 bifunctional glutamate N-acetyltransferase/amino-acid acetyltransferase ArgJ [Paludicola sp. MB14-C6]